MPQLQDVTISIPTITICMPVYNVAPYLTRCLQSVLEQTFKDFFLIAVNDGSTDHSLNILREFAAKDARIQVIDQENQGMSAARNTALARAQSEYVCFLDSDDYLAPTFLEELYQACQEHDADISCCYFYYHFIESDTLYKHPFRCKGVFTSEQALKKLLRDVQLQSYAWNKLYKRKLFTEHQITFPSIAFEDLATTYKLFYHANKVVVINRALHYYIQRSTSTLGSMNAKKINDFLRATAMIRISLQKAGVYENYEKNYKALCFKTNFFCGIYLIRIHLKKGSFKGFGSSVKKCVRALRYYKGKHFDPSLYGADIAEPSALPDVLPLETPRIAGHA